MMENSVNTTTAAATKEMTLTNLKSCKECGKSFSTVFNRKQHEKIHANEKMYKCDKCEKSFITKYKLKRHLKAQLCEKSYVCNICQDTFKRKNDLKVHMKIHSLEKTYVCNICQKTFKRADNHKRHVEKHSHEKTYTCNICQKAFKREDTLNRHLKSHEKIVCELCQKTFACRQNLRHHLKVKECIRKREYEREKTQPVSKQCRKNKGVLGVFVTDEICPTEESAYDLNIFLNECTPTLKLKIEENLKDMRGLKWYCIVNVVMLRLGGDGLEENIEPHFRSKCTIELIPDTIEGHMQEAYNKIKLSFEEFTQRGSGWVMGKIMNMQINIARYCPLSGRSYIPLPKKLANKHSVLNIQNDDNKCLVWCLIAYRLNIARQDQPQLVSHYKPYENEIKLGNIKCPVNIDDIQTIEKLNNVQINVYGFEDNEIFPLYISEGGKEEYINLLHMTNGKSEHYCLIQDLVSFLDDIREVQERHVCPYCLHIFSKEISLNNHIGYSCELYDD